LFHFVKEPNEFEGLLNHLIPKQIPIAYLEGFSYLKRKGKDDFPKKVKTIITTKSYHFDEAFKVWSAEKVSMGSKFLINQHGGNMGSSLVNSSENHQIKISDLFYSWGWEKKNKNTIKPLSALKLNCLKVVTPNYNGQILLALTSHPRYSYIMYSSPIASQFLNYINDQITFAENLDQPVKELLCVRLDRRKYGWDIKSRFRDAGLEIVFDNKENLFKKLKECRLCISTANSTVFLETFSLNYPTLLFWDPKIWELRYSARPFYDELKRVGILHDTPESASMKVNEISDDPQKWWDQPNVQNAKNLFCKRFAYTNNHFIKEWRKELKSIV
jgi:putative transferase (TIGR04331 family)